jgi:adenylylsulfate kinase-like enzyme
MEHDRAGFEQREIALFVGRNLAERMKREMRGLLHRAKRNEANRVGQARFLKRPANARIAREALAAVG